MLTFEALVTVQHWARQVNDVLQEGYRIIQIITQ